MHVAGEAADTVGATALGEAATRWRARGGGNVWTYTHRWRWIPRSAWGPDVSVLASIKHPDQIARAAAMGYAPAIVMTGITDHRTFAIGEDGWRGLPCPAEVGKMTCAQCRLCMNADRLLARKLVIVFVAHGSGLAKIEHVVYRKPRLPDLPPGRKRLPVLEVRA